MSTLNAHVAGRLVGIRTLFERASEECRSPNSLRRATGIILLDAANERVSFDAATALGLAPKREFEPQLASISSHLQSDWPASGRVDVLRLHKARNAVQHSGLGVDSDDIEPWILASSTFIQSLVLAVFEVDIWAVSNANSIIDESWARAFEQAEERLAEGQHEQCLNVLFGLLNEVTDAIVSYGDRHSIRTVSRDMGDWTQGDTGKFLELVAVSTFCVDISELIWIKKLATEVHIAAAADSQRALTFIFWLVISFEASVAARPVDRWERWLERTRLVRTHSTTVATISSYEIVRTDDESAYVRIRIADVPGAQYFESWSHRLSSRIRRTPGLKSSYVDEAGVIHCFILTSENFIEDAPAVVQALLDDADEFVLKAELMQKNVDIKHRRIRDEFNQDLQERISMLPTWVAECKLRIESYGGGGVGQAVILIRISKDFAFDWNDFWKYMNDHADILTFSGAQDSDFALTPVLTIEKLGEILDAYTPKIMQATEQHSAIEGRKLEVQRRIATAFML